MTTPVTEALTVTQADREAAHELIYGTCPDDVKATEHYAQAFARHRLTHTTPTEPVLRWEGGELWLGEEPVAWVDTFKSGQAEWNCTLANFEGEAPTLPEAKTAAEQAVRDWLARAGVV